MGLFSSATKSLGGLFGGATSSSDMDVAGLLAFDKKRTEEEREKTEAYKQKLEEDRVALKQRGKGMQGGGRQGLMFGGNQQGVA